MVVPAEGQIYTQIWKLGKSAVSLVWIIIEQFLCDAFALPRTASHVCYHHGSFDPLHTVVIQENASRTNALALALVAVRDWVHPGAIDDSLLEKLFYHELVDQVHSRESPRPNFCWL